MAEAFWYAMVYHLIHQNKMSAYKKNVLRLIRTRCLQSNSIWSGGRQMGTVVKNWGRLKRNNRSNVCLLFGEGVEVQSPNLLIEAVACTASPNIPTTAPDIGSKIRSMRLLLAKRLSASLLSAAALIPSNSSVSTASICHTRRHQPSVHRLFGELLSSPWSATQLRYARFSGADVYVLMFVSLTAWNAYCGKTWKRYYQKRSDFFPASVVELRDVDSGSKTNERLRTDESVERVFVQEKSLTYLYTDDETGNVVLMDPKTYGQLDVPSHLFGESLAYLQGPTHRPAQIQQINRKAVVNTSNNRGMGDRAGVGRGGGNRFKEWKIHSHQEYLVRNVVIEQSWGGPKVTKDGEQLGKETKITLFLKEELLEYLEERKTKDLVKKHSEFISYPIYLWTGRTTEKEFSDEEDDEIEKEEEGDIEEVDEEKEKDKGEKKKIKEVAQEWQIINKQKPIGLRDYLHGWSN
ncbi:hypothetical protein F511_40613 [Dorcoceras hygrometricum]|uniref:Translation elongation factor P/YeiP central domain-containing protein n=1 Tax=Dorcoceras hygrometricum TaxID=472368 RepID=A0A2Z7A786_9LAMI|nr:hypothetical protein F511_40613 [Dorcoceras hygrometricum]